jgi:hypothetical protein
VELTVVQPTMLGHYREFLFEMAPFLTNGFGIHGNLDAKTACEKRDNLKNKFSVVAKNGGQHRHSFHRQLFEPYRHVVEKHVQTNRATTLLLISNNSNP